MKKLVCYFDGCCEPVNPGGTMGFGAIVTENGKTVWQAAGMSRPDGQAQTSNNLAEYAGLLAVLAYLLEQGFGGATAVEIRGDSKLVVEQMSGRWTIGKGAYVQAARQARQLAAQLTGIRFTWIPRAENQAADTLSKSQLIEAGIRIVERGAAA